MIRRGFTLPELLVASVVLGVALTASVQVTGALRTQQREARHRLCALAEAENCLQRLTATPWEQLTPQHAAEHRLSETAARQLPGGELKIDIAAEDGEPPARRIQVQVHWRNVRGHEIAPLRLTAWVYRKDAPASGVAK
jgi:prepilin-type N-terminal cleavage/methylation domain-containing protein